MNKLCLILLFLTAVNAQAGGKIARNVPVENPNAVHIPAEVETIGYTVQFFAKYVQGAGYPCDSISAAWPLENSGVRLGCDNATHWYNFYLVYGHWNAYVAP